MNLGGGWDDFCHGKLIRTLKGSDKPKLLLDNGKNWPKNTLCINHPGLFGPDLADGALCRQGWREAADVAFAFGDGMGLCMGAPFESRLDLVYRRLYILVEMECLFYPGFGHLYRFLVETSDKREEKYCKSH